MVLVWLLDMKYQFNITKSGIDVLIRANRTVASVKIVNLNPAARKRFW